MIDRPDMLALMMWGLIHIQSYSVSFKNRIKALCFRRYILNIFLIEKIKMTVAYLDRREEDFQGHIDTLTFQRSTFLIQLKKWIKGFYFSNFSVRKSAFLTGLIKHKDITLHPSLQTSLEKHIGYTDISTFIVQSTTKLHDAPKLNTAIASWFMKL